MFEDGDFQFGGEEGLDLLEGGFGACEVDVQLFFAGPFFVCVEAARVLFVFEEVVAFAAVFSS